MKQKPLPEIFKYLKQCEYECNYDEENKMIFGGWFTIDENGLSFSIESEPDFVAIFTQRLCQKFGRFEIYESYYFYSRDNETYFGDEAFGAFMADITEHGMNQIFGDFRLLNSSQNLYTPSFQSQTRPNRFIKVMLSDRWKLEDEMKVRKFFENKGCDILIVWDKELEGDKEGLNQKIKDFFKDETLLTQSKESSTLFS